MGSQVEIWEISFKELDLEIHLYLAHHWQCWKSYKIAFQIRISWAKMLVWLEDRITLDCQLPWFYKQIISKVKIFLDPVMFSFSLGLLALYKDKAKRPKIEANQQVLKRSLFKGGLDLTTTICHRYTPKEELVEALSKADVVVSAAGVCTKNFHVVTSLIIL